MLYTIIRNIARLLCIIYFRLKATGVENIPKKRGFVLASNHSSFLDPVVLAAASPRQLHFMAKDDLFKVPFLGWLISLLNAFPVKRGRQSSEAFKEAVKRLREREALLIFPEGRRRDRDVFSQAKGGVGLLALKAEVPIIPALIEGADAAMPKGIIFPRPAHIKVHFGHSIDCWKFVSTHSKKNMYRQISDEVMRRITELKYEKNKD